VVKYRSKVAVINPTATSGVVWRGLSIVAAPRTRFVVIAVIALSALLKLRRDGASRVALSVSRIDVCTVATRNRVMAISTAAIVTSRGLLLGRQVSVWITHAVAGADVPPVAAGRPLNRHAILDGLDLGWSANLRCRANLKGKGDRGNANDHGLIPFEASWRRRAECWMNAGRCTLVGPSIVSRILTIKSNAGCSIGGSL